MSKKLMVGGQAVIEGVMMRGPKLTATAVRDPQDPAALRAALQDDWLHLNPAGYKLMGEVAAEFFKQICRISQLEPISSNF